MVVESAAPCVDRTRPFSLTWAEYRGVGFDWSIWSEELVLGEDTLP